MALQDISADARKYMADIAQEHCTPMPSEYVVIPISQWIVGHPLLGLDLKYQAAFIRLIAFSSSCSCYDDTQGGLRDDIRHLRRLAELDDNPPDNEALAIIRQQFVQVDGRLFHPWALHQFKRPRSFAKTDRIGISPRLRYKILHRDGFRCAYCGKSSTETELEIDHLTPVSEGGTNSEGNLVAACWQCNIGKSNKFTVPMEMICG